MSDIIELLKNAAKVAEYQTEIEKLQSSIRIHKAWLISANVEIDRLTAESNISDGLLADAKAEIERLQAAVKTQGAEIDRLCELLHRALEPKP